MFIERYSLVIQVAAFERQQQRANVKTSRHSEFDVRSAFLFSISMENAFGLKRDREKVREREIGDNGADLRLFRSKRTSRITNVVIPLARHGGFANISIEVALITTGLTRKRAYVIGRMQADSAIVAPAAERHVDRSPATTSFAGMTPQRCSSIAGGGGGRREENRGENGGYGPQLAIKIGELTD